MAKAKWQRRMVVCLLWALLGPAVSTRAHAQSYGIDLGNVLMPASGGMGGASIASPQDFLSAINANPAALTQYPGTHATLGGAFADPTVRLTQTRRIPPIGVKPFSAVSSAPGAIAPNMGVSYEVPALPVPTVFGVALISTAGGATNFVGEEASNGTTSSLDVLQFAPSIGIALTDRLSLGATVFLGECMLSGPFIGTSSMSSAYALSTGWGINYQVRDVTRVGAFYKSTQAFRLQDHVVLFDGSKAYDTDVGLPQQVGIGLADQSLFDGRLLLAVDVLYYDWSSAALLKAFYGPQWAMQLGLQYRMGERLKLRLGYDYAGNPLSEVTAVKIGSVPIPGGKETAEYLQAQMAVANPHRFTGGIGFADALPGVDIDLFAGGMFPYEVSTGAHTSVSIASFWIGGAGTWRFGSPTPRRYAP